MRSTHSAVSALPRRRRFTTLLLGTALVGGIIGGLLAIPIVMAGRTLLFRYIWKGRKRPGDVGETEPEPESA